MNSDFHYYATYCAAQLAGYSHEESLAVCYSSQLVDFFSSTLISKIKAPASAATTQLQLELMDARTDILGLQNITRIWASFHFLPYDLYAEPVQKHCSKRYKNKYRLICNPNGELLKETIQLAKDKSLQAAGIAMHILSDTWAHRYFAGTPSLVINNTNYHFYELFGNDGSFTEKKIVFRHSASAPDDLGNSIYTASLFVNSENSIMNLGHGRAGHLPDYSFIRYKYLPAWGNYEEIVKDNPSDYKHAFCQMIYAMKYLKGMYNTFECGRYDFDAAVPYQKEIDRIISGRKLDSSAEWKAFGEKVSGQKIPAFDLEKYQEEYVQAKGDDKDDTFIGKFVMAAMAQKSMVTNKIYNSGNKIAGYSLEYRKMDLRGIKDYKKLVRYFRKETEM